MTPKFTRQLPIRNGGTGISRIPDDIAISLAPTKEYSRYPNKFYNRGVLHSYPEIKINNSRAKNEIKSVKKCLKFRIPVFVILSKKKSPIKIVKLGWVMKSDDKKRRFLIKYCEEYPE